MTPIEIFFSIVLLIVVITFALIIMSYKKSKPVEGSGDQVNNSVIENIYETRKVKLLDGTLIPLRANVNKPEGTFIYNLVKNHKLTRCMEIGFAMGLSALHICQAFEDYLDDTPHLFSIDPFQDTNWKCAGVANIKNAGFSNYHTWIKDKSYSASAARGPIGLHSFAEQYPHIAERLLLFLQNNIRNTRKDCCANPAG